MIASISGVISQVRPDSLVVTVGGIGVRVFVPLTVLELTGQSNQRVSLYTHLHWRDNDIALYGFATEGELELFELLLGVSGVGPRLGLAILSTLSPDMLTAAVAREEPAALERVPGVGKKTAQRIMFQLREKLPVDQLPVVISGLADIDSEVIAALTTLGYSVVEAQTAVQHLPRDSELEIEERIRAALSFLGG
jgi:Holliday junction DNA helicase RuvA